jgi:CubicO group peptidase (beta-lactamase class C family)
LSVRREEVDRAAIAVAVAAQLERRTPGIEDMATYLARQVTDLSHREVIGPLLPGTGASGVIVHSGQVLSEWGDPATPEMLFSVTKSLLSTVAGVAFDRGMLELNQLVADTVPLGQFSTAHARAITWRHLLQQTRRPTNPN